MPRKVEKQVGASVIDAVGQTWRITAVNADGSVELSRRLLAATEDSQTATHLMSKAEWEASYGG